jgi:hypothetical protein
MRKSSLVLFAVGLCVVFPVNIKTAWPVSADGGPVGQPAATDSSLKLGSTAKVHGVSVATTDVRRSASVNADVGRTAVVATKTVEVTHTSPGVNFKFPVQPPNYLAPATQHKLTGLSSNMLKRQQATFVENRGQFDGRVRYQLKTGGGTAWLTNNGVVFDFLHARAESKPETRNSKLIPIPDSPSPASYFLLPGPLQLLFDGQLTKERAGLPGLRAPDPESLANDRLVFSEDFVGAHCSPEAEAKQAQPGIYNYFIGKDPNKWVTHVRAYREVIYHDVWDGVDLRLYGNSIFANPEAQVPSPGSLEQEFIVRPGADITKVQVAYNGIVGLKIAEDGSLVVSTALGELRESKPVIYQEVAGKRVPVEGHFKLTGEKMYSFELGSYRSQYALVIDPTLSYSTFLGGSQGYGLVGFGDENEWGTGIAVDSSGSAYVVGLTASTDFPTTTGSFQPTISGSLDAYVTKLSPDGSQLAYSTYLGGSGKSVATGVAVNSTGEAYLTGSTQPGFPTTANAFLQAGFGPFVTKLSAAGDALVYSSYLQSGGTVLAYDLGSGIAVDSSGRAYVTGTTTSAGFPVTATAFQPTFAGGTDGFVTVIDPSQSGAASLVYSTYLGGAGGVALALDSSGNAYVTGAAPPGIAMTSTAFQTSCGGSECAFVAKLNPSATTGPQSLIYSTYVGGTGISEGDAIAVDASGDAYFTGATQSGSGFPTTAGAFQTVPSADTTSTVFVTKVSPDGSKLVYSTFLGGSHGIGTFAWGGIAVDAAGNAYVASATASPTFPTTLDALQSTFHGGNISGWDAFLTILNASGSALVYSTYMGGANDDKATAVALDAAGSAYVTGFTLSAEFPTTPLAYQKTVNGSGDVFIMKFSAGLPAGLTITGLTATTGGNSGSVTDTIVGTGFTQGSTAQLVCGGQPAIVGTNVTVASAGTSIIATFNLQGTAPGTCDVVVANASGTSVTDSQAFTVEQGGAPRVWVDLVGLDKIRVGTPEAFYAVYGNRGNVDANFIVLSIQVPNVLTWNLPNGQVPIYESQINGNTMRAFPLPSIPAGSTGTFVIALQGGNASQSFQLSAWVNPR